MNLRRHVYATGASLAVALGTGAVAQTQPFDPGAAARQLGASGNAQAAQATTQPASSYPGFTTANPPQTQYYNSGTAIQTQAQSALASAPSSDPSKVVVQQATAGPQFTVAPTDPILTQGQSISAQATSLTTSYSGCQTLNVQQSGTQYSTQYCTVDATPATANCKNQRVVTCPASKVPVSMKATSVPSDLNWTYTYPTIQITNNVQWNGGCTMYARDITFNVTDATKISSFTLDNVNYDDYLTVAVNGHFVYGGPYSNTNMLAVAGGGVQYNTGGATGPCDMGIWRQQSLGTNILPYIVTGTNTLKILMEVGGVGGVILNFSAAQYPACTDQWLQTCNGNTAVAGCTQESNICSDGPSTHYINGNPQTRDCWTYNQTYLCESFQQQTQNACSTLLNNGCQQEASTCTSLSGSNCVQYQQTFRCPSTAAGKDAVTLCGSDLYCPNGNCTADLEVAPQTPVTQLAEASAYLQAAQDVAHDNTLASGTISFFGGRSMKCAEAAAGFSDCCAASGWGSNLGLASCNTEEKTLGQARQAGEAHEVGAYSTGSSLLKTTYDVYCVFTSMLSRIIQEQGRVQLGMSWGTPQSPQCQALTQTQMAALDFSKMDFSEFYATAEAQATSAMATIPTSTALQQQLQQQLQLMSQNPGMTGGTSTTSGP